MPIHNSKEVVMDKEDVKQNWYFWQILSPCLPSSFVFTSPFENVILSFCHWLFWALSTFTETIGWTFGIWFKNFRPITLKLLQDGFSERECPQRLISYKFPHNNNNLHNVFVLYNLKWLISFILFFLTFAQIQISSEKKFKNARKDWLRVNKYNLS